jgi:N-acyl-D-aspartate/D-glutamate deacylase
VADLVLTGGVVVDGTGSDRFAGDVVVGGDRITLVGRAPPTVPDTARRIDVSGLVVAPGFIDVHSHSDAAPFVEPWMDSMLRQGVTTMVVGNCGSSAIPPAGAHEIAELSGVSLDELGVRWGDVHTYLDRIDQARPACNVATLVGHGAARLEVMNDARRPPSDEELEAMRRLVADAVSGGAVGLSTGLVYPPGMYAETDEIVELAAAAGEAGGLYASHIRGEGAQVFEAVAEAIQIGRRARIPVHISHLKVESRFAWGRSDELLRLIDDARADGADVSADQYPYTAWETVLSICLPPWTSPRELPRALADPHTRRRLVAAVEEGEPGWESSVAGVGWERLYVGSHIPDPSLSGRSLAEIAAGRGVDPSLALFDLLIADPSTGVIGHGMLEDDVRAIVARPDVMIGTDGLGVSPDGPLGRYTVHPRYYGTFPRILGRYVREGGLLTLEDAVRKMTSLAADRFGLVDRGRVSEGAFADLVVFDPGRITDTATYERPHTFAEGIGTVIVNGRVAWDGARGERAGRALRRG